MSLEEQPRRAHATHPVARSPHSPAMPLQPARTPPPISPDRAPAAAAPVASAAATGDRVVASPFAKKLAEDLGVDIASVVGTGPDGRIQAEDVEAAAAGGGAACACCVHAGVERVGTRDRR